MIPRENATQNENNSINPNNNNNNNLRMGASQYNSNSISDNPKELLTRVSSTLSASSRKEKEALLISMISEMSFWEPAPVLTVKLEIEKAMLSGPAAAAADKQSPSNYNNNDNVILKKKSLDEELDALDVTSIPWKPAVDPASGRTYYYDSVTRKTQWEKPREIRLLEKKKKRDQRRADKAFFDEMEQNLKASIARGEIIPLIKTEELEKAGAPREPLQQQQPAVVPIKSRVRTISGMDHNVLAQLDGTTLTTTTASSTSKQKSRVGGLSASSEDVSSSDSSLSLGGKGSNHSQTRPPLIEGRPPLAQRGSSGAAAAAGGNPVITTRQSSISNSTSVNSMDSLEFSPEAAGKDSIPRNDCLRGIDLLVEGNNEDATTSAKTNSNNNPAPPAVPPQTAGSHVRRNTGGTMFVDTTMDNPDVDATMKCVCGVYRAHIVQAAKLMMKESGSSPISVNTVNLNLDVFLDDFENQPIKIQTRRTKQQRDSPQHQPVKTNPVVPSLEEIKSFYREFYQRSQMEYDTIIMSLIYVERLIKETNGALTPTPLNWRSVLFSCMILASKVWDDLSMWNIDFSNVSVASGLSAFSLKRINQLELAVLTSLGFRTAIPASEYAKYYFLIRTMLLRSGLLGADGKKMMTPLSQEEANKLENRTSHYQDSKLKDNNMKNRRRAAKSMDWSCLATTMAGGYNLKPGEQAEIGPVLKDAICLEQIVSKSRS